MDPWPDWISEFLVNEASAPPLLREFLRQVRFAARTYPDAYFALGHKDDDGFDDLGHRAFTICARREKGRFPFQGRTPFATYGAEAFDGRAIRYHSFYAKLSITRELMRDDYARNLVRDPVLRWRAALYGQVGDVVKAIAEPVTQGRGLPPAWLLHSEGPQLVLSEDRLADLLQDQPSREIPDLVRLALSRGGARSQSRLTRLLEQVLPAPAAAEAPAPPPQPELAGTLTLRQAVVSAWQDLGPEDQTVLAALARGASYDELIAADPRFKHKVAVTRALGRINKDFLARIAQGTDLPDQPAGRPLAVLEALLEVLVAAGVELEAHRVA